MPLQHLDLPNFETLGIESAYSDAKDITHSGTVTKVHRRGLSRPEYAKHAVSTLLDSDATRLTPCTVAAGENSTLGLLHNSGAMTPPATPTELQKCLDTTSHGSYFPSAGSVRMSQSGIHTNCSTLAPGSALDMKYNQEPGNEDLKVFPHWITDYSLGPKDKRKLLGSGLWSDVYLAVPSLDLPSQPPHCSTSFPGSTTESQQRPETGIKTPPTTPSHSREPSFSNRKDIHAPSLKNVPSTYAVKIPASRTANRVLTSESRILSQLSSLPGFSAHIVPFYGQDTRSSALVMGAMDMTLEQWVRKHLNTLPEEARQGKLNSVFPALARDLVDGLSWLGESGCTHADIKPSNILVDVESTALRVVYSDFSSAILSRETNDDDISTQTAGSSLPLGGGTWDFLDPDLLVPHTTVSPSPSSDLWALVVTLLNVVIGCSPFDCAGANVFRRRECVKQGTPLAYVGYGDEGARNVRRLKKLGESVGWDVGGWFGVVLGTGRERRERVGVGVWAGMMGGG